MMRTILTCHQSSFPSTRALRRPCRVATPGVSTVPVRRGGDRRRGIPTARAPDLRLFSQSDRSLAATPIPAVQTEADAATTAPSDTEAGPDFDWREQWYPIAFADDIPKGLPYKFTLFDEPMVAFLPEDGAAPLCFVDRCPHRRAPLSDGALMEDGTVMCGYHGWQFDSEGSCTNIPQIGRGDSRACATALPAVLFHQLLFVWPTPRAKGEPLPSLDLIPSIPGSTQDSTIRNAVFRDMPGVDMPLLLENIIDPDHGQYAHQIKMFEPFCFKEGRKSSVVSEYFPIKGGDGKPSNVPRRVTFTQEYGEDEVSIVYTAPCFVEWRRPASMGPVAGSIYFWTVPLGLGRVRFLSCNTLFPNRNTPTWLRHMFLNKFLDEDTALLAHQGAFLLGAEAEALANTGDGRRAVRSRAYAPRSPSDKLLLACGRFLDATVPDMPNREAQLRAMGSPTALATALPSASVVRRRVLDRMATHTAICPSCQTAVANFSRYRLFLQVAAITLAVTAVVSCAALVGSSVAAVKLSASATSFVSAVCGNRVWLAMSTLSVTLAGLAAFGASKLSAIIASITGYEYTQRHFQKDLQKIPGVAHVPVDLKWAAFFER